MPLGWGIVSAGSHPNNVMAPAINESEGASLAAIYARDQNRVNDFMQHHEVGSGYISFQKFLKDLKLELRARNISMATSETGSSIHTGLNLRSKAASRSIYLRYSSGVVAPTT